MKTKNEVKQPTSATSYTPGPWNLIQDGLTDDIRIHATEHRHIADVTSRQHIRMVCDTKQEREGRWVEVVANACLIASAPELLEAAKELEKYLAICFQEKQGGNGGMINGLIKLRAVIAKAEGK